GQIILYGAGAEANVIQGNYIGTTASGRGPIPGPVGIAIAEGAANNVIGGTALAARNIIAFSQGDGVRVHTLPGGSTARGNTIRGNTIYSNGGLGINLQPDGEAAGTVTLNDPGDGDSGPNNLQNFPTLNSVTVESSTTIIKGYLNSTARTVFKLDFYRSPAADASGYGEGKFYIGSARVTTNKNGNVLLNVSLPIVVPAGQRITATATNAITGDTSEFSRARIAVAAPSITVASTPSRSGVRLSLEF
ncbi:MAG TPA: hypothetical protein VNA16_04355, partial [Abditibacteriaceae bacterium]|nr:hypothetical protein [Abditibacteriaceae bacterium]